MQEPNKTITSWAAAESNSQCSEFQLKIWLRILLRILLRIPWCRSWWRSYRRSYWERSSEDQQSFLRSSARQGSSRPARSEGILTEESSRRNLHQEILTKESLIKWRSSCSEGAEDTWRHRRVAAVFLASLIWSNWINPEKRLNMAKRVGLMEPRETDWIKWYQ